MLNDFFRKILWASTSIVFHVSAYFIAAKNWRKIYVFDIDNTTAYTWPSLKLEYSNEKFRLSGLAINIFMRNYILKKISDPRIKVLFISQRSILQYLTTYNWLRNNGIAINWFDLFLVKLPGDKISFFKILNKKSNLVVIDDLSYNHENNSVIEYFEIVGKLKKLKIKYHGRMVIERILN